MGQHGSKSAIEARVIFQRVDAEAALHRTDAFSSPAAAVHIQKRASSQVTCSCSSARTPGKSTNHSWSHSRLDAGGLVYVMDNPTGGVWVKPRETWTRS